MTVSGPVRNIAQKMVALGYKFKEIADILQLYCQTIWRWRRENLPGERVSQVGGGREYEKVALPALLNGHPTQQGVALCQGPAILSKTQQLPFKRQGWSAEHRGCVEDGDAEGRAATRSLLQRHGIAKAAAQAAKGSKRS